LPIICLIDRWYGIVRPAYCIHYSSEIFWLGAVISAALHPLLHARHIDGIDKNNGLSTAILADRSIIGKRLKYKLLEIENLKASLLSTHNIMKP